MRPHIVIQRILHFRRLRPPNSVRPFTQNANALRSRPRIPFLSASSRRPTTRLLSTETKTWFKDEMILGIKYCLYFSAVSLTCLGAGFSFHQIWMEHRYPTPKEWSYLTRYGTRFARWMETEEVDPVTGATDWVLIGIKYLQALSKLEDVENDGKGLEETDDGGILVEGIGKTGFDITSKSEEWRRGYWEVLMGCAKSAEYLDGWVYDTSRHRAMSWDIVIDPVNPKIWQLAFPGNTVRGPSNPNPGPIRPGMPPPPKEENCEPFFDSPDKFYMKILTTQGFTEKQKVDAALAYGLWLDYKQTPETAGEIYDWALDIATSGIDRKIVDRKTGVINTTAGVASENVLAASTALAIHYATNNKLAAALPIFVSVLRARKALPPPDDFLAPLGNFHRSPWEKFQQACKFMFRDSVYPPDPGNGNSPPVRDAKQRCEEAGIMAYIGEILYASNQDKRSREDGLAWTREAVDNAEAELRQKRVEEDASTKCRQCLETGLENWMAMVLKMSIEERAKNEEKPTTGWLGFGAEKRDVVGRWESEEKVVRERYRRAADLLQVPPKKPFWSF